MSFLRTLLVGAASVLLAAVPAHAQDFKVIVNSANTTTDLSSATLSKLFLKESAAFPNGTAASPVDLGKDSPVRSVFSKKVLGRSSAAVETFWQQQIFSGKEVPPPRKASDDEVVAFVKANPGAIGYVSAGASTAGVKVVDIK